jgi:hypothetical protein
MSDELKAVAFDLDAATMVTLRAALPEWEIEMLNGATATSLSHDWNAGEADLLVLKAREDGEETLGMCRFLAFCGDFSRDTQGADQESSGLQGTCQDQPRRENAPLLLLVSAGQESLVRAALEAGADSCLVLPVHVKAVASTLARLRQAILHRPVIRRGSNRCRYA